MLWMYSTVACTVGPGSHFGASVECPCVATNGARGVYVVLSELLIIWSVTSYIHMFVSLMMTFLGNYMITGILKLLVCVHVCACVCMCVCVCVCVCKHTHRLHGLLTSTLIILFRIRDCRNTHTCRCWQVWLHHTTLQSCMIIRSTNHRLPQDARTQNIK